MAANRITVHVAGQQAGQVDIDVQPHFLPPLPWDADGDSVMPTNFCGLHIRQADAFTWLDESGEVVEAENNVADLQTEDPDAYNGGIEFTGPIDSCEEGGPWYFPIPLSFGGNGQQFGAARLVIELTAGSQTIQFIDHNHEPVELPDLFDDIPEIPGIDEFCDEFPDFCEPVDDSEDPNDPDGEGSVLGGSGNFKVEIKPTVHPPQLGNLKTDQLETHVAVAINFLRMGQIHARALKALADAVGIGSPADKGLRRELRQAKRYARLTADVEEVARDLLRQAIRERATVDQRGRRSTSIAFHRALAYSYAGFAAFRHSALSLDAVSRDIGRGRTSRHLPSMLHDLDRSADLLEKALLQIYTFHRVTWPIAEGQPVFELKRRRRPEIGRAANSHPVL